MNPDIIQAKSQPLTKRKPKQKPVVDPTAPVTAPSSIQQQPPKRNSKPKQNDTSAPPKRKPKPKPTVPVSPDVKPKEPENPPTVSENPPTVGEDVKYPTSVIYRCFWCHDDVVDYVKCPLDRTTSLVRKTYFSHITRDVYSFHEHIPDHMAKKVEQDPTADDALRVIRRGGDVLYDTNVKFCSFNCALAFIRDHASVVKYNMSPSLIAHEMLLAGIEPTSVVPAAPITRLLVYGGTQTYAEYKRGFINPVRQLPSD